MLYILYLIQGQGSNNYPNNPMMHHPGHQAPVHHARPSHISHVPITQSPHNDIMCTSHGSVITGPVSGPYYDYHQPMTSSATVAQNNKVQGQRVLHASNPE